MRIHYLSNKTIFVIASLPIVAIVLAWFGWAYAVSGRAMSPSNTTSELAKARMTICLVNGEAISLADLEAVKLSVQSTSSGKQAEGQTYQQLIDYSVRRSVMRQEAVRRGLQVSEEEARAYYTQQKEAMAQLPQAQKEAYERLLQAQASTQGLTTEDMEKKYINVYRSALTDQKLRDALAAEAPNLDRTRRNVYVEEKVQQLIRQANVQCFLERLPQSP